MVRYRQTERATNASRDNEQLLLLIKYKNKDSDCFGIAYEVNDAMCIQCPINNTCKHKYIELQQEKREYTDLL
jgi:hypothetical protein